MARYLILTPIEQYIAISDTNDVKSIYKLLWTGGYYDDAMYIGYDPLVYALDSLLASIFDCIDNFDKDNIHNTLIHKYLIGDVIQVDGNEKQCINIIRHRYAIYKGKPELVDDNRYNVIIPEQIGVYDIRDCIKWNTTNNTKRGNHGDNKE